jgi:transcriptional regulator with XRE-family HTH domain
MSEQRLSAKISLRKLATQLGISAAHLSDMERGNRKYSIEWCKKTMSILNKNQLSEPLRP